MSTPVDAFEKVVAPWVARGILDHGYYHLGGAVARAADLAGWSPDELTRAWRLAYPGSPFPPDPRSIDVLRFPHHPLMELRTPDPDRPRPWPTYPTGFLAGDRPVPVWQLTRTRVPFGTELWRVHAEGRQEVLASFDGPASGWRGGTGYYPPTHFVGTRAKAGVLDVPAELREGAEMVELVVVDHEAPPGFEPVRDGVWRQLVPRSDVDSVFELELTCTYEGVPCRILQQAGDEARLLLKDDRPGTIERLHAEEADLGAFEITVPRGSLDAVGGSVRELAVSR